MCCEYDETRSIDSSMYACCWLQVLSGKRAVAETVTARVVAPRMAGELYFPGRKWLELADNRRIVL